jgi:hypothetical protein
VVGQGLWGVAGSLGAVVESGDTHGIAVAGGAVVASRRMDGLAVAAAHVRTEHLRGVAAAGWVRAESVTGLTLGVFNEVRGTQRGLAVGLVNSAEVLEGVQIGLINHAGNNPPALRWTPVLNAHFG